MRWTDSRDKKSSCLAGYCMKILNFIKSIKRTRGKKPSPLAARGCTFAAGRMCQGDFLLRQKTHFFQRGFPLASTGNSFCLSFLFFFDKKNYIFFETIPLALLLIILIQPVIERKKEYYYFCVVRNILLLLRERKKGFLTNEISC